MRGGQMHETRCDLLFLKQKKQQKKGLEEELHTET